MYKVDIEEKEYKALSYISLVIPALTLLFLVNYAFKIVPFMKVDKISMFFPVYISPLGIIISCIILKYNKGILVKLGLAINILVLLSQIVFLFAVLILHTELMQARQINFILF